VASPFRYDKKTRRRKRKLAKRLAEIVPKWEALPKSPERIEIAALLKYSAQKDLERANAHRKKRPKKKLRP
jgi:hypothetical protein